MVHSFDAFLPHRHRTGLSKSPECFDRAIQEFPDLSAGLAVLVLRESLRCVCEHELVAFFDRFKALPYLGEHVLKPPHPIGRNSTAAIPRPTARGRNVSNRIRGSWN